MTMESFENSTESDPREAVDTFLKSFDGLTLETSDGKRIGVKLEKKEVINSPDDENHSEGWVVEFENYEIEQHEGNYLAMIIDPDTKSVEISLVRLTDKDLQGKNIYPQLMNHIGANFPEGFTLRAIIEHNKTKDKMIKLFNRFKEGVITEDDLKTGMMKSGILRMASDAGFNDIKAVLNGDDIEISANKNMGSETTTLSAAIQEAKDSQP